MKQNETDGIYVFDCENAPTIIHFGLIAPGKCKWNTCIRDSSLKISSTWKIDAVFMNAVVLYFKTFCEFRLVANIFTLQNNKTTKRLNFKENSKQNAPYQK